MNISMNPSYVEEFNGSDYVCMTGGTLKSAAAMQAAGIQHASTQRAGGGSGAALVASGIATSGPTSTGVSKLISGRGVPVASAANETVDDNATTSSAMMYHHYRDDGHSSATAMMMGRPPSVSPTPSQRSSESGSSRRALFLCH